MFQWFSWGLSHQECIRSAYRNEQCNVCFWACFESLQGSENLGYFYRKVVSLYPVSISEGPFAGDVFDVYQWWFWWFTIAMIYFDSKAMQDSGHLRSQSLALRPRTTANLCHLSVLQIARSAKCSARISAAGSVMASCNRPFWSPRSHLAALVSFHC